ncbi:hypothetical protein JEZ23_22695 [Pseudomonas aeruginosa]|uniref:hypothetical protein n=1 Tax=Pseudomonas aeruginosa TaxID=287 RepID=UPI000BFDF8A1|nr:hypothetical protein [Pseudomonas aeruginosa]EKU1306715.1 hypothetical protein [Pseudomonas aeruginosa]EKU1944472.1 hypothetical protein [Pseudomonas aeruginosa]MBG4707842.1 hypothetical protein [Pseudomonas aeruginosa]MBI7738358.1 hypothetical protein [Pseudomonas aeruginosa]MBI8516374.1 hypothetical protein [Pseudomonas aeruginosa]
MTKEPISEADLISLCEEGNCAAFVQISATEGKSLDALVDELGECTFQVFGAGFQQVSSPAALLHNKKSGPITVQLVGAVRTSLHLECPETESVFWEASIVPLEQSFYFKRSAIDRLAGLINGADELEPREQTSVARLLSILADMAELDISKPKKAADALCKYAETKGLKPLSPTTIKKYVEWALDSRSPD